MKAFPTGTGWNHEGEWIYSEEDGMDLRDYFAAKAMQATINAWILRNIYPITDVEVAKNAYAIADAMMEAREK